MTIAIKESSGSNSSVIGWDSKHKNPRIDLVRMIEIKPIIKGQGHTWNH